MYHTPFTDIYYPLYFDNNNLHKQFRNSDLLYSRSILLHIQLMHIDYLHHGIDIRCILVEYSPSRWCQRINTHRNLLTGNGHQCQGRNSHHNILAGSDLQCQDRITHHRFLGNKRHRLRMCILGILYFDRLLQQGLFAQIQFFRQFLKVFLEFGLINLKLRLSSKHQLRQKREKWILEHILNIFANGIIFHIFDHNYHRNECTY